MDKKLNSFKQAHGKKTYRMAWIVEFCLFFLGISIAAFNIIFGLKEGDLITGSFMAIGWVLLAVIELSVIPLAGSLRMSRPRFLAFPIFGLVGLLFLSAFTVYEFNEIASEYITRGARRASIEVDALKQETKDIQDEISRINVSSEDVRTRLKELSEEKNLKLDEEKHRYNEELGRIESYYNDLITDAERNTQFPIYNPTERARSEKLKENIVSSRSRLDLLNQKRSEIMLEIDESTERRNSLLSERYYNQLRDLDSQIEELNKNETVAIDSVGGWFSDSKIKKTQSNYELKRKEIYEQREQIMGELSAAQTSAIDDPRKKGVEVQIAEVQGEINSWTRGLKEIEAEAAKRMDSPAFQKIVEGMHEERNRVYADRESSKTDVLNKHESNLEKIEARMKNLEMELADGAISEADRVVALLALDNSLNSRKNEIRNIVEETSIQYEKTMYFRMASWFSGEDTTGFGKLPSKEDYNRSLQYIFAPIGLFFGMAAIVLAFMGTSFMYEADLVRNSPEDEAPSLTRSEREFYEHRISEFSGRIRKQRVLEKRIKILMNTVEKNEDEIIRAKSKVFETAKVIPQTIHIGRDEKASGQQI